MSILMHLRIISAESDNITDRNLMSQHSTLTIKPFNAYFHISRFSHFQTTKLSKLTIKPFNAYSTFPDYQT